MKKQHLLTLACVLGLPIGPAQAATIAITNSSFETTTLVEDGLDHPGVTGWTWDNAGYIGTMNPQAGGVFFSSAQANDVGPTVGSIGTMTGRNIMFTNGGGVMSQTTAESITVGQQYTLTVAIGQRDVGGHSFGGYTIALWDADSLLAAASSNTVPGGVAGNFADVALTYTSLTGDSGNLRIFLTNNAAGSGSRVTEFDNVRLDAVPEPSSAILIGLAGLVFSQRRRR